MLTHAGQRWSAISPLPGSTGPPTLLRQLGLTAAQPAPGPGADQLCAAVLCHPGLFPSRLGASGAGAAGLLLRRRAPADLAVAGLLAGALVFTLTFFFISIACDYRYLIFLDLAAMAAALIDRD